MSRNIVLERAHGELSWRWKAYWMDETGWLHIGLALTRRGAIRDLRKEIDKERARRQEAQNRVTVEVDW